MEIDYKETVETITRILDDSGVMMDYPLLIRIRFLCGEALVQSRMTKRRKQILLYIKSYIEEKKHAPTWATVAEHFDVSYQYVRKEMLILQEMGYVRWDKYAPGGLRIVRLPDRAA